MWATKQSTDVMLANQQLLTDTAESELSRQELMGNDTLEQC